MARKGPSKHRVKGFQMTTSDGDREIIDWLAAFLATSKSEAVRTAIRAFAGQMASLEREIGRSVSVDRTRTRNKDS